LSDGRRLDANALRRNCDGHGMNFKASRPRFKLKIPADPAMLGEGTSILYTLGLCRLQTGDDLRSDRRGRQRHADGS
jgi:hypothetical protein